MFHAWNETSLKLSSALCVSVSLCCHLRCNYPTSNVNALNLAVWIFRPAISSLFSPHNFLMRNDESCPSFRQRCNREIHIAITQQCGVGICFILGQKFAKCWTTLSLISKNFILSVPLSSFSSLHHRCQTGNTRQRERERGWQRKDPLRN